MLSGNLAVNLHMSLNGLPLSSVLDAFHYTTCSVAEAFYDQRSIGNLGTCKIYWKTICSHLFSPLHENIKTNQPVWNITRQRHSYASRIPVLHSWNNCYGEALVIWWRSICNLYRVSVVKFCDVLSTFLFPPNLLHQLSAGCYYHSKWTIWTPILISV